MPEHCGVEDAGEHVFAFLRDLPAERTWGPLFPR
jgi:hypothetical protein